MRAFLAAAAAAFMIFGTQPALALKVDMKTLGCEAYAALSEDDREVIMTWLYGYDSDEEGPQVIDTDEIGDDAGVLAGFCAENATMPLFDALEKAFE